MVSTGERDDPVAVSIVIPCRNCATTLPELLDSLGPQQFAGGWEIVAVDDGSMDRTREVLEGYRDRLPITVVTSPPAPRSSGGRARNVGVASARGELVLFLDADDVVADSWGKAMQHALEEHGFVACHVDDTRLNDDTWRRARAVDPPEGLLSWWDYPYPCAAGGALGVRRAIYEAAGGMDESLPTFEDVDFCWRVQQDQGVDLVYVPDAVLYYRYRSTLRGVFDQARAYGRGMVDVFGRYRTRGLPVPPHQLRLAFWAWLRTFARLARIRDRGDLGAWLWRVGGLIGLAEASARERRLLLCADPQMGRTPFSR